MSFWYKPCSVCDGQGRLEIMKNIDEDYLINKFMEYSIKFDFVTATEKDIKEHKWEKYKLNIK